MICTQYIYRTWCRPPYTAWTPTFVPNAFAIRAHTVQAYARHLITIAPEVFSLNPYELAEMGQDVIYIRFQLVLIPFQLRPSSICLTNLYDSCTRCFDVQYTSITCPPDKKTASILSNDDHLFTKNCQHCKWRGNLLSNKQVKYSKYNLIRRNTIERTSKLKPFPRQTLTSNLVFEIGVRKKTYTVRVHMIVWENATWVCT